MQSKSMNLTIADDGVWCILQYFGVFLFSGFFILDYFLYVIHDAEQVDEPRSVDERLSSCKPGVC